jgi:hypothetical protein
MSSSVAKYNIDNSSPLTEIESEFFSMVNSGKFLVESGKAQPESHCSRRNVKVNTLCRYSKRAFIEVYRRCYQTSLGREETGVFIGLDEEMLKIC